VQHLRTEYRVYVLTNLLLAAKLLIAKLKLLIIFVKLSGD
jgi:hypothetical protein